MNILILRVSSIGDVIHTLPSIFLLKKLYPNAKISWIVQHKAAALLQNQPFLEKVWILPDKFLKTKNWNKTYQTLKEVNKIKWDAILDFQGILKTSILLLFLKGDIFGFDSKNSRTKISSFLNKYHTSPIYTNIIQKNLALVNNIELRKKAKQLDILNQEFENSSPTIDVMKKEYLLNIPKEKQFNVNKWLEDNNIKNFITLSPNTTWHSLEHWEKIITLLSTFKSHKIILLGKSFGQYANTLYKYIQNNNLNIFSAPEWDLITTSYLISKASLLVAPDTGLLHLADFLNIKTIGIFGPTSAQKHGPFLSTINMQNCIQIDCPHHYKKTHGLTSMNCMIKLKPEKLLASVKKALSL